MWRAERIIYYKLSISMYIISSMSFETIDEVKDQLLRYGDQLRKDTLVYEVDIKKVFVANRDIRLEIDSKDKRNK